MAKYYILYTGFKKTPPIWQTDVEKNSESEVREHFKKFFNQGILIAIRRGNGFTESEINKKKKSLKYAQ